MLFACCAFIARILRLRDAERTVNGGNVAVRTLEDLTRDGGTVGAQIAKTEWNKCPSTRAAYIPFVNIVIEHHEI